MNDKLAKVLRGIARAQLPDSPTSYLQHTKRGYIVVAPDCQRGLYLFLKRNDGATT